jgi:hypothetical protein
MTKHAAGGGVEREHPKVNRLVGHGHGGEPDTADGGQCACGAYRPLVAEQPIGERRARDRDGGQRERTSWSIGTEGLTSIHAEFGLDGRLGGTGRVGGTFDCN